MKFRILQCEFQNLSEENFDLLTQKRIFPYKYCTLIALTSCRIRVYDCANHSTVSLTGDTVSESDYAHVTNVWQQFSVQSLDEYSDLYLKTDVLLLADIFENFRDKCIESYGLDPYYYTLSGFTWDAMLKHTRINFELFTNIWWFYRARYTRRS